MEVLKVSRKCGNMMYGRVMKAVVVHLSVLNDEVRAVRCN